MTWSKRGYQVSMSIILSSVPTSGAKIIDLPSNLIPQGSARMWITDANQTGVGTVFLNSDGECYLYYINPHSGNVGGFVSYLAQNDD